MSAAITPVNPSSVWQVPENFRGIYTHAAEVSSASRMLFISGQFGVRPDGTLPDDFAGQAEQAMQNVEALLAAASMGFANVAKLAFFLTRSGDAPELVAARVRRWGDRQPPAVTVVTVTALAKPDYLVEVEATAVA